MNSSRGARQLGWASCLASADTPYLIFFFCFAQPQNNHAGYFFLFISGKYAYIEVTGKNPGDNAKLVKGGLSFSTKKCLSFYYHMYGATMGTLNVLVGQKNVFTLSGDQGNQWKQAKVEITEPGASEVMKQQNCG